MRADEVYPILLLCLVCAAPRAPAQSRPDPFAENIVAIRARRIETISHGTIKDGVIVIRGGKITAVGADATVPVGARVLQADTVMPGIVGAYSQIGVTPGTGTVARSDPHLRVADELYPWDDAYRRLLRAGVTTLALLPAGRGFPGQGAVVRTEAESAERMALTTNGPLSIDFAPNTQTIDMVRSTLQGARPPAPVQPAAGTAAATPPAPREPAESGDEQIRGQRRRPSGAIARPVGTNAPPDIRRAPVARAVQGETPTIINCPDAASVLYLLPLLQPYDTLKPVFVLGVGEMHQVTNVLGAMKASVVLPAVLTLEPLTRNRINVPAIYAKAGAKIALRPIDDTPEGYAALRYQLSELVRHGLDRDTALRAITLSAAEMLGISDRAGSIDVGRDASLLLFDTDPLEPTARVRAVLLDGRIVFEDMAR